MPCKPAEYDLGIKDGERSERELDELTRQRHDLRRVLLDYATDPDLTLPAELQKALGRFVSEKPRGLPPRPDSAPPERYSNPRVGSWALELAYRVIHEEKVLCEGRTLLLRLAAIRPPAGDFMEKFEAHRRAHSTHRMEDLECVRDVLRQRLSLMERLGRTDEVEMNEYREKLRRAEALSVDDILEDRSELDSLWPGRS